MIKQSEKKEQCEAKVKEEKQRSVRGEKSVERILIKTANRGCGRGVEGNV